MWNKIPKYYIRNLFDNFIKRCNKIIELKGGLLEPEHLRDIRRETEKEKEKEKFEENAKEDEEKRNLKLKLVYSKNELIKKAKKEIAIIRKKKRA